MRVESDVAIALQRDWAIGQVSLYAARIRGSSVAFLEGEVDGGEGADFLGLADVGVEGV